MTMRKDACEAGKKLGVGISSCLLGHAVRFNGGHKQSNYVTDTLQQYFDFVPVCPEVAIGLGIPRAPIRLIGSAAKPRAVGTKDPTLDVTEALAAYGAEMARRLQHLSGYIFKRASPSCGMERVKVYDCNGVPSASGTGIYAKAIMEALPTLPVEEEGRLMDAGLRENFVERVYVYHRWQQMMASGISAKKLIQFHTAHKFIILSRGQGKGIVLGRLAARAGSEDIERLARQYIHELMQVLKQRATRKRHTNVLQHLMGYLKRHLDTDEKAELQTVIEAYRQGQIPLIVPVTMLRYCLRRFPNDYLGLQQYMAPYPDALSLRNAV